MEQFRYEIHCHTSQGSLCGQFTGAQLAEYYAERGYQGVIITDHFFNGNCAISPALSWEERVERFFDGYEEAKKVGDRLGLQVFYGWEYNYLTTELLTYGLDKQWLIDNPDILSVSVEEYCERVHKAGGFLVHAHPFREREYISYLRLLPNYVDAIETVNAAHHLFPEFDKRADFYADSYRLRKLVGSDFHFVWPGGLCAVDFEEPLVDTRHFCRLVAEGRYTNWRLDVDGNVIAKIG